MSLITTDSVHYQDIADAIRYQNGGSATYRPDQMAAAILAISGGGSELPVGYAVSTFSIASLDLTWQGSAEGA